MYFLHNDNGDELGPFTMEDLKAKALKGEIPNWARTRHVDSQEWKAFEIILDEANRQQSENAGQCGQKDQESDAIPSWCLYAILFGGILSYLMADSLR